MGTNYYPESHWVMKAPIHSLYPDVLMATFPDADIVVPHRDPVSVIPSWTKLCAYVLAHYYDEKDDRFCFNAESVCRNTLEHMVIAANRFTEYRRKNPQKSKQFCDVYYQDVMKDPIGVVKSIYEHYGYEYSIEFEDRMKQWLKDNPQGKYGRVKYSLEEFNLTKEEVYTAFSDYLKEYPRCRT